MPTLADLKKNERAVIKELKPGGVTTRLLSFGCIPGKSVGINYKAPFGGPICVSVNGSLLAMRKSEAKTILVESKQ